MRPFYLWTVDKAPLPNADLVALQFIGSVEGILTGICLTVAALALRWRFRRG